MSPADRRPMALTLFLVLVLSACGEDVRQVTTTPNPATTTTERPSMTTSAGSTTITTATTTTLAVDVGDLLVVGDWGSGTLPQGAVAGEMARHAEGEEVAAILTTGDNFYSDDVEFLMEPFGWAVEAGIPFWISWGNHDVATERRAELVDEVFDDPPRWTVHDWGGVDVVILDSTDIENPEQTDFLAGAMESDRPAIVAFHHPAYSCGSYPGSVPAAETWLPMFDEQVFLVLNGHDHNYQRFEEGGTNYMVTGGGGAGVYQLETCPDAYPRQAAGEAIHHFLILERSGSTVSVRAVDVNGESIDELSVELP